MTQWLGSVAGQVKPDDDVETRPEPVVSESATLETNTVTVESPGSSSKAEKTDTKPTEIEQEPADSHEEGTQQSAAVGPSIEEQLEEVSTKAISTAKEWGSYLYSFGKTATQTVAKTAVETAKNLKDTVEEKTIIGQFNKEQEKFVTEQREKKSKSEAAVPPWVGYNEEEAMKTQILALSSDKRNFLRNPPSGVQFQFDFESSFPIATVMLQEDPNLKARRFELVPKQVKEEVFWRNYFYRVSLIKQSAQLTSLAQETGSTGESGGSSKSSRRSSTDSGKEKLTEVGIPKRVDGSRAGKDEDVAAGSPPEHEFVSDAFGESQLSQDELRMLGVSDNQTAPKDSDDVPEWERELAAELQEYEVVDDGSAVDDTDLEKEILQQIEAEAGQ
jgi:hypothetical protein